MQITNISLAESGFLGCAYLPEKHCGRAVIVVTGSDGGIDNAKYIAQKLAGQGFIALAVGYYRVGKLNPVLRDIPLEYIRHAIRWLQTQHSGQVRHIAGYGISKGAEYMLLASTLFHEIEAVVALAPTYFAAAGMRRGIPPYVSSSSWSYAGHPLPYAPLRGSIPAFLRRCVRERQFCISFFYERAIRLGIPSAALIPIEKSHARILLLSGGQDCIWPASFAARQLTEKLENTAHPFAHRHIHYEKAGHILTPLPEKKVKTLRFAMRAERQNPEACAAAREDAFFQTVKWLGEN